MNSSGYSNRSRSRSKQPIYTSDKRAHLTQRDNKKWLRLLTVFGYVVFVSAPAITLSIYYTCIWDPMYIEKYNESRLAGLELKQPQNKPKRSLVEMNTANPVREEEKCACPQDRQKTSNPSAKEISLEMLLKQHAAESDVSVSSEDELLSSSTESKSSESQEVPHKLIPAGA